MAYTFQYTPRSNYPVRLTVDERFIATAVVAAHEMIKAKREAYEIAYNALDIQYGSKDDAIALIEDTVFDHMVRFDAIDAVYDLAQTLEDGEWELGDTFDEAFNSINA